MTDRLEKQATHRGFLAYIVVTALFCGAFVMVIEVLGSRVIGPLYGVSLFVWTSLITVTLVALAVGYVAGGILADRKGDPSWLYGIILFAGVAVLAIPHVKLSVLQACQPLGLRGGAFASSLLLFGPALFFLGCVSPYVIKISARQMQNIGRTVGLLYAVSTFGSFLGTVCTGFILIAYFGVNRIFDVVGIMLVTLAAGYFVLFQRKIIFAVLFALSFVLPASTAPTKKQLPDGTRVNLVFEKDSFYGNIKVIDYHSSAGNIRSLLIDGLTQGQMDIDNGMSITDYPYFMEFLPYSLNPKGRNCLVIGLGAGLVPMWYETRGVRTDVIEINPNVVAAARDYFGFRNTGEIFIDDARYHLNNTAKKYDYIVLDVYNGDTTPGHVLSLEALQQVHRCMNPRSILALNLIGSLQFEPFMTASIIKTIKEVFATVEVYPAFDLNQGTTWGNLAVVAHDGPPIPFNPDTVRKFPVHRFAKSLVSEVMGKRFSFTDDTATIILTDEFNPVDFSDTWLKEELRKTILNQWEANLLS